jgi:hypothetical protein
MNIWDQLIQQATTGKAHTPQGQKQAMQHLIQLVHCQTIRQLRDTSGELKKTYSNPHLTEGCEEAIDTVENQLKILQNEHGPWTPSLATVDEDDGS